jgi:hypothetical protein
MTKETIQDKLDLLTPRTYKRTHVSLMFIPKVAKAFQIPPRHPYFTKMTPMRNTADVAGSKPIAV